MNTVILQLQAANVGIEDVHFDIYNNTLWVREKDLHDAKVILNSRLVEFAALDGIDPACRIDQIKDFFLNNYEQLVNKAYTSANERTQLLNNRSASDVDVPGLMLLSDILFIREMSDLRLAYASTFYGGDDLVQYRAAIAQADLTRLKLIKDGLMSAVDLGSALNDAALNPYVKDMLAVLASWEIVLRAHIELHDGRKVEAVDLETPRNLAAFNTFGNFGDMNNTPDGICGDLLTDNNGTSLAGMFSYGDSLAGIFDASAWGDLAAGRFIRMVHNGKNLVSDLNLVPVMKRLLTTADMKVAPGAGQFFVDPALGRFVLPRPAYWTRFENVESITSPEISNESPVWIPDADTLVESSNAMPKMGYGIKISSNGANYFDLYPFGMSASVNEGAFSGWYHPVCNGLVDFFITVCFGGSANRVEVHQDHADIYLNNVLASSVEMPTIAKSWAHVYVVWRKTQAGSMVRVYANGQNRGSLSGLAQWIGGVVMVGTYSYGYYFNSISYIDNWKAWKEVVSENPNWEYNGGNGREDALHVIYGNDGNCGYRPVLASPGGMGYYYIPPGELL